MNGNCLFFYTVLPMQTKHLKTKVSSLSFSLSVCLSLSLSHTHRDTEARILFCMGKVWFGLVWFLCLMAYQLFSGYLMPKPFS